MIVGVTCLVTYIHASSCVQSDFMSLFQMVTNRDIYLFVAKYSGLKKDVVKSLCSEYNIKYDDHTMGSRVISERVYRVYQKCKRLTAKRSAPFWSEIFEIRVLESTNQPVSEDQIENKALKRKV